MLLQGYIEEKTLRFSCRKPEFLRQFEYQGRLCSGGGSYLFGARPECIILLMHLSP